LDGVVEAGEGDADGERGPEADQPQVRSTKDIQERFKVCGRKRRQRMAPVGGDVQ
jgi:hypothetical protein